MKVLITGGMGVIGAEVSRKFANEGHRPVIFVRHRDDSLIVDNVDFEQVPQPASTTFRARVPNWATRPNMISKRASRII